MASCHGFSTTHQPTRHDSIVNNSLLIDRFHFVQLPDDQGKYRQIRYELNEYLPEAPETGAVYSVRSVPATNAVAGPVTNGAQ